MSDQCSSLADIMREILLENELGGNAAAAYRFIDCDGSAGRSGYSFGVCQFDLGHNDTALRILAECGFSYSEQMALKNQTGPVTDDMKRKLVSGAKIVDRYDLAQCKGCIDHVLGLALPWVIPGDLLFHLADYHNQFYLSPGKRCHSWLQKLPAAPSVEEFLSWKLLLPWGLKRPDDVKRRWGNIQRILAAHGVERKTCPASSAA